jgi:HD-GYP domain-containing protein (c-di-GMP phosphodiesterase class II)
MAEDLLGLGDALDVLQGLDEQADALNTLGQQLVNGLFALLRTAGMHSLNNQAMDRPFSHLKEVVGALGERVGGDVVLRQTDGNFFVNKRLVRLDYGTFQNVKYLERIFEFLNINELTFADELDDDTIRAFTKAALGILRAGHGYIEDQELGNIRVRKMQIGEIDELRRDSDPRNRILGIYASGLLMLRQFVLDLRAGRSPRHARVKRLCQDLINVDSKHHNLLLALVHLEAYKGTLFCHMMNTAVLSIVFGHRLGLSRRQLADLGMAAFHHDLGWALLADERLENDTSAMGLRMEAINSLRDTMGGDLQQIRTRVARSLVRLGGFNEMVINRLIVSFECQVPENRPAEDLYYTEIGPSFMSNVVRIASAYDELSTSVGGQPALLPDEAMRHILDDGGKIYDAFLSKMFAHSLGAHPVGTMVELDTTEVGLVINLPTNPVNYHRPQVKILIDRSGRPQADGPVVDLDATFHGGDRYMRTIERTLDSRAYGVSITRFFFGLGDEAKPKTTPPGPAPQRRA